MRFDKYIKLEPELNFHYIKWFKMKFETVLYRFKIMKYFMKFENTNKIF